MCWLQSRTASTSFKAISKSGLDEFADQAFDHVVLSRTLQTVRHTEGILREMLRVGREAVVSFPNFAYWKNLRSVLDGRMPVSEDLPYQWYDSPNVRFFTLLDFEDLCTKMGLIIRERSILDEAGNPVECTESRDVNFLGSLAVYRLTRNR
jgi:methionine biosynthesis protein MetW